MNLKFILPLLTYSPTEDDEHGSVWVWVLMILSVMGIVTAMVLPSLISCGTNKAVRAEAKSAIGSMNRAQQAYFLEEVDFAKSLKELGVGIKEQTENYTYYTQPVKNGVLNYAIARREYVYFNWFSKRPVTSHVGAVFVIKDPKASELLTIAIACENNLPGVIKPATPTYSQGFLACGQGTKQFL